MAYISLYRNFRPIKFSDVIGQDHIIKTLKNQVVANRVGHAYLFTGGRGTGKTTSAKILSRAVNCLNPQDGEPCNECEICKEILEGSLPDVVEMDAASYTGVDDIRGIRDEVNFLPTKAKYRVYIIDEVHMLSGGAFNALLKTLEEPPEHVKFILATTEPQKVPVTILSRCQRFDFKSISNDNIVKRLKEICKKITLEADEDALYLIATLSEGHMRDAISILERCSQEGKEKVDISLIRELVGLPKTIYINKISNAIIEKDAGEALSIISKILEEGKDLEDFLWEIIKYFKDILVYKSTGIISSYSKEDIENIDIISKKINQRNILNIIYRLSDIENDIKWSNHKTIMFETGILRLCDNEERYDQDFVEKNQNFDQKESIKEKQVEKITENKKESQEKNSDLSQIVNELKKMKMIRWAILLSSARIEKKDEQNWDIIFENGLDSINKKIVDEMKKDDSLKEHIKKITSKDININFVDKKNTNGTNKVTNNDLGIDINIIN